MNQNPYLFVVGCPRSGTTLLQRMLDGHPQLAVANDTHFIPKAIGQVDPGVNPPMTPELLQAVREYQRFPRLGLPEAAVDSAAENARTYSQFVSALYAAFAQMHDKPLGGEKTPDYVRELPRLHALFPWAKIIHLVRDGRDVALSALEWARERKGPGRFELWAAQPVAVCALWWRWQVSTGRQDGANLPRDCYREIQYEDLVSQPEESLRALADFLELPFSPRMVAFYEGKTRPQSGLSAKSAWLPATRGLRDWRTQMGEKDAALFEALAGDVLGELGYELRADTLSEETASVAERCRNWWELEMSRRRHKPGKGFKILAAGS